MDQLRYEVLVLTQSEEGVSAYSSPFCCMQLRKVVSNIIVLYIV